MFGSSSNRPASPQAGYVFKPGCGTRWKARATSSHQNPLHHVRLLDARTPHIQAAELVREACVVDSETVQDRRVEITQVHRILRDIVAEVIRGSVLDARLDAAAGEPHGEAASVMIAAHSGFTQLALAEHRAPK